jgi:hypothetical protein
MDQVMKHSFLNEAMYLIQQRLDLSFSAGFFVLERIGLGTIKIGFARSRDEDTRETR